MKKKHECGDELDNESMPNGSSHPERNSGKTRKSASHTSVKRKRNKPARRKGNTTGGIHQRGDKRVMR